MENILATHPFECVVGVIYRRREGVVGREAVIYVQHHGADLRGESTAIWSFGFQAAEAETAAVVHDDEGTATLRRVNGGVGADGDAVAVAHWDAVVGFGDGGGYRAHHGVNLGAAGVFHFLPEGDVGIGGHLGEGFEGLEGILDSAAFWGGL